jgi:cell filamentation protein
MPEQSASPTNTSDPRWTALQRSGDLREDVTDYREYFQRAVLGLATAASELSREPEFSYAPERVAQFHRTAFEGVDKTAGEYRTRMVQFGDVYGADGIRVERELELLEHQHRALSSQAQTREETLAGIVFAHARFIRIHGFNDGNGRTGRALMTEEAVRSFGISPSVFMETLENNRAQYMSARNAADGEVTLLPDAVSSEKRGFMSKFLHLFSDPESDPQFASKISRDKVGNLAPLASLIGEAITVAGGGEFDLRTLFTPDGELYAPFHVAPALATNYELPSWNDDWKNSIVSPDAKNQPTFGFLRRPAWETRPDRDNVSVEIDL